VLFIRVYRRESAAQYLSDRLVEAPVSTESLIHKTTRRLGTPLTPETEEIIRQGYGLLLDEELSLLPQKAAASQLLGSHLVRKPLSAPLPCLLSAFIGVNRRLNTFD